jgi:hydroxymethylglutaryl-CoA synthase
VVNRPIGISDISLYFPQNSIDVKTIVARRSREAPELKGRLERAVATTGQDALRFPSPWEDTATMGAEAALCLLRRNQQLFPPSIRYLAVGTESGLDHAKPVSTYVQGMLQLAGVGLPDSLSSFQVQHACAGGTLALLSVGALLNLSADVSETGLVICSDIARYDSHSTAEITQGAGAAAMLVERSPRLLEVDMSTVGFCSRDVDDFFRPLGSTTARVRGGFSLRCYMDNLECAVLDHCKRRGQDPARVLEESDFVALHTPFHNMPEMAMLEVLCKILGLDVPSARRFLEDRGFYASISPVARVGNVYCGSLYLCLCALLFDRYRIYGSGIVDRSLLLASYGSGNTMLVMSARVAPGAPEVIEKWDLDSRLTSERTSSWDEYDAWMRNGYASGCPTGPIPADGRPNCFFLGKLREDGYREYGCRAGFGYGEPQEAEDLYGPVSVIG